MSQDKKKGNGNTLAIISLIVTLIAALLGSPLLVEWFKNAQNAGTPTAVVSQTPPEETEAPITLTPLPGYTEQTLIFQEDFDNDNVSGFAYEGNWQVNKDKNNRVLEAGGTGKAIFGPSDFTNGVIEFRVQIQESSDDAYATMDFRENGNKTYALSIMENQLTLGTREGDNPVEPFGTDSVRSLVFEKGAWYLIRIEVRGPEMIVYVDDNRIMSASDSQMNKGGLSFGMNAGMQAAFDDVRVWELK